MARDDLFSAPAEKEPEEKSASAAAPPWRDKPAPDNFRNQPLAARMRPRNLDEYAGQTHILGSGQLLRRAIEADRIQSLIFYGPPGTGKTSLARPKANSSG
jgi:putative ATPase